MVGGGGRFAATGGAAGWLKVVVPRLPAVGGGGRVVCVWLKGSVRLPVGGSGLYGLFPTLPAPGWEKVVGSGDLGRLYGLVPARLPVVGGGGRFATSGAAGYGLLTRLPVVGGFATGGSGLKVAGSGDFGRPYGLVGGCGKAAAGGGAGWLKAVGLKKFTAVATSGSGLKTLNG